MAAPVLAYENLGLIQGSGWLFRGLDLYVGARDRLALIGRNGVGKTTLLKCIADLVETDEGRRTIQPGIKVVLLEQDPPVTDHATLRDFALAAPGAPAAHEVEAIADQIGLDLDRPSETASGGERRRAAIARAIAQAPDVLLMDEPTNHLDLAGIAWLEEWLGRYTGAFVAISHDRTFLKRLTKSSLWLDRGQLRRAEVGYGGFEAWTDQVYAEEARAADKLDAKLKLELHWLQRGVTARRKRNQGRLAKLGEMRAARAAMLGPAGTAKLALENDDVKTKMVIEAQGVSKSYGGRPIIKDFSLRIQRGDRIGVVGANGAGKTTLLKLLTGEIEPDVGKVTRARTLTGIMIDQQRKLLDPDKNVRDILADGGDWIEVRGTKKHVQGYLKEFLFEPGVIDTRIGALSGGERSRLLLAREFARASNLLVLDEPTNDLDMETLDLLQEVIADYDGTVLIVSHDRDFLDRTVTITLGLDGSGRVDIVAGGYEDWERKRGKPKDVRSSRAKAQEKAHLQGSARLRPLARTDRGIGRGDRARRGGALRPRSLPPRLAPVRGADRRDRRRQGRARRGRASLAGARRNGGGPGVRLTTPRASAQVAAGLGGNMKHFTIFLGLAAFALTPAAAPAQNRASAEPSPAVAPIHYQARTLANGLRVYAIRDTSSSSVSVQVWYDVGSKDDPRGRSGFAHLFEHMMFKSTRNLVPEQFDRLTEDVGGFNNASTNDDYTNYYEVVPANHLQRLLWAEAERMSSLVIEPGFFNSERDVVKEELRSRVLAAPYGRLFYLYLPQISYDVHPYARPGIGSIADLDAATIEDVRAFHATYYRPDNAVLVVAGNFDPAQFDRWVDQYFAPIARPAAAIPRVTAVEPERRTARSFTVYEANTPLPAVLIAYPAPPTTDEDATAMEVLDGILSTGESSRLHQTLVYRDRIASNASSFVDIKQGRGTLAVYAILAAGQTAQAGEAALRREIARFRDAPVSAAELAEARNELLTSALRGRETVDGRASAIAEAVIVDGDPAAADRRLARIAAVTPADIQRAARRWLRDEASGAVRYLPEESRNGATGDTIATPATIQTAALGPPANIAIIEPAPEGQRIAPPPPAAEIVPPVPAPNVQRLANGLSVVTVENHRLPLVTAWMVAGGGAAADPEGRAGAANLTAAVMTEGTASRSAAQIDAAVEALGASLSSSAGWDGAGLGLTVQAGNADAALAIVADVAQHPALSQEELDRQRALAIDAVTVSMSDPGDVAGMTAMRALYGAGAYGHPSGGTAASLRAITRADLQRAYSRTWVPAHTTLVLSGDITPARARALAQRHFGGWRGAPIPPIDRGQSRLPPRNDVIVIDMPGSGQAAVAVARNTINRRDPRYYRAIVANAVLGGGYSARLNQEIRIRRGLSYGSGSGIEARRESGPFSASTQTRNDAAAQVLGLILAEMRRLGAEPISTAELTARRASLTGDFGRDTETTSGVAGLIAGYVTRGLPPGEIANYLPGVLGVTPGEAQGAAAELLAPEGSTIVIVGEASQFLEGLRRQYPNVTVIPIAELNLDRPALR